jgi:hypothetical protein
MAVAAAAILDGFGVGFAFADRGPCGRETAELEAAARAAVLLPDVLFFAAARLAAVRRCGAAFFDRPALVRFVVGVLVACFAAACFAERRTGFLPAARLATPCLLIQRTGSLNAGPRRRWPLSWHKLTLKTYRADIWRAPRSPV